MDIGVIGIGNMGLQLARRLAQSGHRVRGFDPRPDAGRRLESIGASTIASAAELAALSQAVILMVLNDRQAEAAVWGEEGFAAGACGPRRPQQPQKRTHRALAAQRRGLRKSGDPSVAWR